MDRNGERRTPERASSGRRRLDRRAFLGRAAGLVAGAGLLPVAGILPAALPTGADGVGTRLPPRTVGLRSEGGDFRFDPAGIAIEPGETLRWLNMGDFHTTTAFHPRYDEMLAGGVPLRIPEEAEPWHSGMLGLTAGTRFEHRFAAEGVHDYFCQPHYSFGMVGRVVVGGPRGGPAVRRPLSELNEPSRRRMPPVEAIVGPRGRTFEWASRINGILWLRAEGSDPAGPAGALAEAAREDAALDRVLDASAAAASGFRSRLASFVEAARSGAGYEELVALGDRAKAVLGEVHGSRESG